MAQRREFLKIASSVGMMGLSGCSAFRNESTSTSTDAPTSEYLSGQAVDLLGTPLSNGTVRVLAKPEDSYIAGLGMRSHEELGRAETDENGDFIFQEFPKTEFETIRSNRDLVMVIFRHPAGWFLGGTLTTDVVFDSSNAISTLRPVYKLLVPPTIATNNNGVRRGVVSVWQWFDSQDVSKQRIGVEVSVTNPRKDLSVYNVHNWLNPDTNTEHQTVLNNGSFSLEVPEEGVEVDYNNITVERAKPTENVITGNTGTETPLKALEKWHPKREVQELELGIPAHFMLRDLYAAFSDEDVDNFQEKQKVMKFALGATPIVGQVLQAVSALNMIFDIFDANEDTAPSTWPTVGTAIDREIDLNEKDLVQGGCQLETASIVLKIPYNITTENRQNLAIRGIWSGTLGSARIEEEFSVTSNRRDRPTVTVELVDDETGAPIPKGTVLLWPNRMGHGWGPKATDSNGLVSFENLGEVHSFEDSSDLEVAGVRAHAAGYTSTDRRDLSWRPSDGPLDITLEMEAENRDIERSILTVVVDDSDYPEIPSVTVEQNGDVVVTERINSRGRAQFSLEDGAEYTVSADGVSETRTVTVDGNTEITLGNSD